jgi:hypothetical protein
MSTIEPFKISIPKPKIPDFVDKVVDKTKDVGGNVVDKTKDIGKDVGGKVVDIGKDIGGKVVDIGKGIGGKLVDIGKGIGKILGPAFKKLLEFLMMILKNWKLALGVVVGLFILFWVSRIAGFFRMFSG